MVQVCGANRQPYDHLSSLGVGFTNPGMELLSGGCGGQTAIMCGTTSIAANYLSPGTTYYIRVYSTSGTAPTTYSDGVYSICVVDPVATPPFNDDCANAINLPIWNNCNNVGGNMAGATPSAGPGLAAPCAGTVTYDVWYKFTAVTTNVKHDLFKQSWNKLYLFGHTSIFRYLWFAYIYCLCYWNQLW